MINATVVVTQATLDDLEPLAGLLAQLSPPAPGEHLDPETGRLILKGMLSHADYFLCVARIDGEPVGTAMLLTQRNLSHGGRPYAHLENVVIDARFRGNGIGQEMLRFLIDEARARGCYKVILNCGTHNIPFYERCGFEATGEVEMRLNP